MQLNLFVSFLISMFISVAFGFLRNSVPKKNNNNKIYYHKDGYPCDTEYYNDFNDNKYHPEDTLYIVIWKQTRKTQKLIDEMETNGLRTIFIPDDTILLPDIVHVTTDDMPLVYKNEFLLETWVDIYAEIYPM